LTITGQRETPQRSMVTDDAGTVIQYIKGHHDLNPKSNFNGTEGLDNDEWTRVEFPYGTATVINSSGAHPSLEGWRYVSGSSFDWEHVYKLTWQCLYDIDAEGYFVLDGLRLPSIEVKSIEQDATSITNNGKRMLPKRRADIKSQVELDAMSASMLEKYKNPLQTLKLTVIGNTDILYPGQSLDVNAPPHGIATDTKYRIQSLKHIVSLKANAEERDYDYITKLELIAHTVAAATQYTTPWRHQNPLTQWLMDLQEWLASLLKKEDNEAYQLLSWAINNEIPYGTSFPSNPSTGQRFVLTVAVGDYAPGIYFYDGADWVSSGIDNLDDILDGEEYGNVIHSRIHEAYFKHQHCKFEGEEVDGWVIASPGEVIDYSPSYIKATTDNDVDDNVIFTTSGTAFSVWPSLSQHPYSFRTRVRFNRPTTSFEMFLMLSAANGATNGAFGWWIPPDTGKLTRFWTKGGVWTTSEHVTPLRNRWYTLSAFFDTTSGIAFQQGNDQAYYAIQDDTLTIDGDMNPMWIQITTKAAQTATLEISYWSSILDWREI